MLLLDKPGYSKVIPALRNVTINKLFARSVVEQKVAGKIFVNDTADPTTFYVIHPYGMSLLFGEKGNREFNEAFRSHALNTGNTRTSFEWMQVFPGQWDEVLGDLFHGVMTTSAENAGKQESGIVELNTRVNFKFNPAKHQPLPADQNRDINIVRADGKMFRESREV